jgi:G3E family GTPase
MTSTRINRWRQKPNNEKKEMKKRMAVGQTMILLAKPCPPHHHHHHHRHHHGRDNCLSVVYFPTTKERECVRERATIFLALMRQSTPFVFFFSSLSCISACLPDSSYF